MTHRACREPLFYAYIFTACEAFIIMSFYAYNGANFGALSLAHYLGYRYAVASNAILVAASFISSLYMWQKNWEFKYVLMLVVVGIVGFGLSIPSVVFFTDMPTKETMKAFLFPVNRLPIPGALDELQSEGKCCGIDNYTDYMHAPTWIAPKTCCNTTSRGVRGNCGVHIEGAGTEHILPDYRHGCIPGDFSDLEFTHPNFWHHLKLINHLNITTPLAYVIYVSVLIYYLVKYGRPKWVAWYHGGRCHLCLQECCGTSKNTLVEGEHGDQNNYTIYNDSAENLSGAGSGPISQSEEAIAVQTKSEILAGELSLDRISSQNIQNRKSKDKLVRFSETTIVYPYNSKDRFQPIEIDEEGNPVQVMEASVPVRPGYRYTLAPLKLGASKKPVPRLVPLIDIDESDDELCENEECEDEEGDEEEEVEAGVEEGEAEEGEEDFVDENQVDTEQQ